MTSSEARVDSTADDGAVAPSKVAVLIVNYGTAALVQEAIESILARAHGGREVEVHVVDNASPGDDAQRLRELHGDPRGQSRVVLYLSPENLGFGGGNNLALDALVARGEVPDYVFLLNPDARLANEAIDELAAFLDTNSAVAAVGAAIARPDGARVRAAFRFPNAVREFMQAANSGVLARWFGDMGMSLPPSLGCQEVDWVSGAAVMVRFSALRTVGHFDPDFFLYFEEAELMWRLRQAGYAVWHVPTAQVVHVAGAATGMQGGRHESRRQPGYWYESWRLFHVKAHGTWPARTAALARLVGASVNVVLQWLRGRHPGLPVHFFPDFYRHVVWPLMLGDPLLAQAHGQATRGMGR